MSRNIFDQNERLCSEESVFVSSERCSKAMKIACRIYIQRSGARILVVENVKAQVSILAVRNGTGNVLNVDSMNLLLPTLFFTE